MSEPETINMCGCPYCNKDFIREDEELVCKECAPLLDIDIAVGELISSVNFLTDKKEKVKEDCANREGRYDLLLSVHHKFTTLLKSIKQKE